MNLGRFARGYRGGATLRPVRQLRSQAYPEYAGVPPDTDGSIGDKAIDTTTKIVYKKRGVANREGAGDSILFPINLFPSVGDFDFSVRVRTSLPITPRLTIASSDPWPLESFNIDPTDILVLSFPGASTAFGGGVAISDGKWHTLRGSMYGGMLRIFVDGVQNTSSSSAGATGSARTGMRCLWSPDGSQSQSIKCCDLRLTGPGGSIIAPLDEGTGTTITNQAGANGTLTDGSPTNFWYAAWVPLRQGF